MSWSCRRPGCATHAEVVITYDAVACQVWLDPLDHAPLGGQALCGDHALRLSPPRGWVVMDRRQDQSELVSGLPRDDAARLEGDATARADRTRPARTRRPPRQGLPRRWGEFTEPQLAFTIDADADADADLDVVVDTDLEVEVDVVVEVDVETPITEPDSADEPEVVDVAEDAADDAATDVRPRGRLLGRAFDLTGDQRSALSVTVAAERETDRGVESADAHDDESVPAGE